MKRLSTIGLAVLTAISWITVLAPASPACANKQIYLRLADYRPGPGAYYPFYWVAEGESTASFTVERTGDNCDDTGATVDYDVASDTAQEGSDFTRPPAPRRTKPLFDPFHYGDPHQEVIDVSVTDDGGPEPVEQATVVLSNPQEVGGGAHLGNPSTAPLYIVDDDAPSEGFTLAESAYSHIERQTDVAIPVFREGPAAGSTTMTYQVQHSTTTGNDWIDTTAGSLNFEADQRMKLVRISLINDGTTEPDEVFTVSLTGPGAVGTTSSTVTIVNDDTGETQVPQTRFHHPRHHHGYRVKDWRVQISWHIFARDVGGSEVSEVEVALRKRLKSGSCSWLAREGFVRGPCSAKRWLTVRDRTELSQHPYEWLYDYDPRPRIPPSVGTRIRNYTIYSRATDGAGNVETEFDPQRNANTFEVTRE